MTGDGGRVFATMCPGNHPDDRACGYYHPVYEGISLRQWYAGQAIQGKADHQTIIQSDQIAAAAFRLADAMIDRGGGTDDDRC